MRVGWPSKNSDGAFSLRTQILMRARSARCIRRRTGTFWEKGWADLRRVSTPIMNHLTASRSFLPTNSITTKEERLCEVLDGMNREDQCVRIWKALAGNQSDAMARRNGRGLRDRKRKSYVRSVVILSCHIPRGYSNAMS